MKVIAIIPARYGSSRFPGKPLAQIAGKPLIQWVYELAKQVPELEEVYVATDDNRIAQCVQAIGGKSILTGQEHLSGSDRLAEAARIINLSADAVVVNIQGDQFVFPTSLISELITVLQTDPDAALTTPIRRFNDLTLASNPNVVKAVFDRHHHALYFSRAAIPHFRDNGKLLIITNTSASMPIGMNSSSDLSACLRVPGNRLKNWSNYGLWNTVLK